MARARQRPPPSPPPPDPRRQPTDVASVRAWCGVIEQVLDEMAARGLEDDDRPRLVLATLRRAYARDDGGGTTAASTAAAVSAVAQNADERREALEEAHVAAMGAAPGAAWLDVAFAMLHLARYALGQSDTHATQQYLVSAWHRLDEPAEDAQVRVDRAFKACLARETTAPARGAKAT